MNYKRVVLIFVNKNNYFTKIFILKFLLMIDLKIIKKFFFYYYLKKCIKENSLKILQIWGKLTFQNVILKIIQLVIVQLRAYVKNL